MPVADPKSIEKNTALSDLQFESTEENALKLSEYDKKILNPFVLKLQNLEVYEYSEISDIIEQLHYGKSENQKKWKNEISKALYSMNQEKYSNLINLIN